MSDKGKPRAIGGRKAAGLGSFPRRHKSVELPEAFDRMNPLASDDLASGLVFLGGTG